MKFQEVRPHNRGVGSHEKSIGHEKKYLSPNIKDFNSNSSRILVKETININKTPGFSINQESNTTRKLSLVTPNKALLQPPNNLKITDFFYRNSEIFEILQEAYTSLNIPPTHQNLFDRIFTTFTHNLQEMVRFYSTSESEFKRISRLNQLKISQLESKLAEINRMFSEKSQTKLLTQNKLRMEQIDKNLKEYENLKLLELTKSHIPESTKATDELMNLYTPQISHPPPQTPSTPPHTASLILNEKHTQRDLEIAGFEFWKTMLKSKGINIQNLSAKSILDLFKIKGPSSFTSTSAQTERLELQKELCLLEKDYVDLKSKNSLLQKEKEEDMDRIRELQLLERTLEERIKDLQRKKHVLESNLEEKELEITKLNYKVSQLKDQADKRKEEFDSQRKKLNSLAKNLNEIKMERSKLIGKLQRKDNESQSALSFSDSDDDLPSQSRRSSIVPTRRISALEEIKEDALIREKSITPIDEEEEDDNKNLK